MNKKTKKDEPLEREKKLTTHVIVIHQELQQIVTLLEGAPQKLPTVGAIIGGRIEIINEMMRELNNDPIFNDRFKDYVKELNEEQRKRWEQQEKGRKPFTNPSYMG